MVRPLTNTTFESGICSPIHREWRGRIMSLRPVRIRTGAWMQDSFSLSSLGHLAIRPNSWRLFTALSPDAPGQRYLFQTAPKGVFYFYLHKRGCAHASGQGISADRHHGGHTPRIAAGCLQGHICPVAEAQYHCPGHMEGIP